MIEFSLNKIKLCKLDGLWVAFVPRPAASYTMWFYDDFEDARVDVSREVDRLRHVSRARVRNV